MTNIEKSNNPNESEPMRRDTPLKGYSDEQLIQELKTRLEVLYHTEGYDQLMDKLYDLFRSSEKKRLDFDQCLYGLNDQGLIMLTNDLAAIKEVIISNESSPEYSNDYRVWKSALMALAEIHSAVLGEYYERTQLYQSEIEKLKGAQS